LALLEGWEVTSNNTPIPSRSTEVGPPARRGWNRLWAGHLRRGCGGGAGPMFKPVRDGLAPSWDKRGQLSQMSARLYWAENGL